MITVSQIREHLLNLLDSSSPADALDAFDEWFAKASWNMHQNSDLLAQKFASGIELRLAEYESQNLSQDQLLKELKKLLRENSVQMSMEPVTIVSGTSSSFSSREWPFVSFGSPLVKAF